VDQEHIESIDQPLIDPETTAFTPSLAANCKSFDNSQRGQLQKGLETTCIGVVLAHQNPYLCLHNFTSPSTYAKCRTVQLLKSSRASRLSSSCYCKPNPQQNRHKKRRGFGREEEVKLEVKVVEMEEEEEDLKDLSGLP